MSCVERVLIVGGGVAGMALAISLQRAGITTEIAEIDRDWRVYGAGITLTGPALRALDRLGLLAQIAADAACYDATRICDVEGRIILPSRVSGRPLGPNIPNGGGILRPVLHAILSAATRTSGATINLGVGVVDIEQAGDAVAVAFTGGATSSYDLVVAADGAHSRARDILIADGAKPAFTGQGCWRAVVPRPAEIDCGHVYIGGPVKAGVTPVSRDEMYLFLLQQAPGNPRLPEDKWPGLLAEQLRPFGGMLGVIRDGLNAASRINYRPLESLLVPPPWHRGRAILIGDAAHATTPHLASGAALALEDALVLAELLRAEAKVDLAFARFMTRRYERCRMVVENSRRLGEMEMAGEPVTEQAELSRCSALALCEPI
jgi:2-polyprenyl-6-methoxyphenol hydroxylase-like FAD-dependent oxidoreductase